MRLLTTLLVLVALAGCGTPRGDYVAPWQVGQAGPPFPYNSPYCP